MYIICFSSFDVINLEMYFGFFIKPFSYMPKNVKTKVQILKKKKSF